MIKTTDTIIFPVEDDPAFTRDKQNNVESFAVSWTSAKTGRLNGNVRTRETSAQELANKAHKVGGKNIRIRRQWIGGYLL